MGANPRSPADFVSRLLAKDSGWLASYFDTLSRVRPTSRPTLPRLGAWQRFYDALRGHDLTPFPTKHSFRPDPALFLLEARLQVEPNGQPHIPGNIDVWKEVLRRKTDSKLVHDWGEKAGGWNNPGASSRRHGRRFPLRDARGSGLQLPDANGDRPRAHSVASSSMSRLPACWPKNSRFIGDQYPVFAEFHASEQRIHLAIYDSRAKV